MSPFCFSRFFFTVAYNFSDVTNLDESVSSVPNKIDRNTVTVVGSWDNFNITWSAVTNVNYGIVFYEIKVDSLSRNGSMVCFRRILIERRFLFLFSGSNNDTVHQILGQSTSFRETARLDTSLHVLGNVFSNQNKN